MFYVIIFKLDQMGPSLPSTIHLPQATVNFFRCRSALQCIHCLLTILAANQIHRHVFLPYVPVSHTPNSSPPTGPLWSLSLSPSLSLDIVWQSNYTSVSATELSFCFPPKHHNFSYTAASTAGPWVASSPPSVLSLLSLGPELNHTCSRQSRKPDWIIYLIG